MSVETHRKESLTTRSVVGPAHGKILPPATAKTPVATAILASSSLNRVDNNFSYLPLGKWTCNTADPDQWGKTASSR